mgnify:CR=1 FL=1
METTKFPEENQWNLRKSKSLKNTKFDFQELTKIDNRILDNNGIDTCYSVKDFNGILRKVACAYSDLTKMGMTMYSDQPGLVF